MAGHLLISEKYECDEKDEQAAIRKIVRDFRKDLKVLRDTDDLERFEAKYKRLPDDYLEGTETEAYTAPIDVPESIVWGGRATIEVHFRMSFVSKIYLVA